jgi:methyl-accepting chemotaxis protein
MGQLDQVTQTNSATSQETASAAEELSAQADSLKNQVLTLVAVINGSVAPVSSNSSKLSSTHKKDNEHLDVVPMKKATNPAPKMASKAKNSEKKKVISGKDSVPSYDHPGFEDV